MRCEDVMKKNTKCISAEDSVQLAAQRMRDENIGFLPVCDADKRVLGTVTDRDLAIRVLAGAAPARTKVQEIMTRDVVSCRPGDDLERAEELMALRQKSRIVCLSDDGRLAGVISLSDVAEHEEGARSAQTLRQIARREVFVEARG